MINGVVLLALAIASFTGYAAAQVEGDLRLVDGRTNTSGRVEIFHDGIWGTICDDQFGSRDVHVVCRQLGLRDINRGPTEWRDAPAGTGTILLDNLACKGAEERVVDCPHEPWGQHNCVHDNDAGVECDTESFVENMRLVGGTSRSGRLEVNYAGTWGPVCGARFDIEDAQVACRTLGFDPLGAERTPLYGRGSNEPLLANVNCNGSEFSMSECSYTGPYRAGRYCSNGEHVGLNCMDSGPLDPSAVTARLTGGSAVSGRLELSVNGVWGTVCGDGFDDTAAKVACRMLGLPTEYSVAYRFSLTNQNLPITNIWLDDVQCDGTEQSLVDCEHLDWRVHNCYHTEDVGVFCTANEHVSADGHPGHHADIRLAGSNDSNSGRVEVNFFGIWGTVCDDRWRGRRNTLVVCRSLSLHYDNAIVTDVAAFSPRSGPIWLDDVRCTGRELTLLECPHAALGIEDCGPNDDVAVICQ